MIIGRAEDCYYIDEMYYTYNVNKVVDRYRRRRRRQALYYNTLGTYNRYTYNVSNTCLILCCLL